MMENDIVKWTAQFNKGYLELCVLQVLANKKTSYGTSILQALTQAGLSINEGTLYPLLNRMHKNGWLESYWQEPHQTGHPRRYYNLSDYGKSMLHVLLENYALSHQAFIKLTQYKEH